MHSFRVKFSTVSLVPHLQPRIIIRTVRNRSHSPIPPLVSPDYCSLSANEDYSLTADCLKSHKISPIQRERMVDWMIEVTSGFQCSSRTLFISVKIMDKFFSSQHTGIHAGLLHIIGIASMLIASKLEDVEAITLDDAKEKMPHNKFSLKEIRSTEQAILRKLGFLLNFVTRCDFIEEVGSEVGLDLQAVRLSMGFARISLHFYAHLARKE